MSVGLALVPELELVESVCKLALVEPVCDPLGSDSFESFFFSICSRHNSSKTVSILSNYDI